MIPGILQPDALQIVPCAHVISLLVDPRPAGILRNTGLLRSSSASQPLQAPVEAAKRLCSPLQGGLRKVTPSTFPLWLGGAVQLPPPPQGPARSWGIPPGQGFLDGVHHRAPELRAGPTPQRQVRFLDVTFLVLHETPPAHKPFPAEGTLEEPLPRVLALVV